MAIIKLGTVIYSAFFTFICFVNIIKMTVNIRGDSMRKHRNCAWGIILVSFGIGLFIACCFPSSFLVAVIAVALVLIGVAICKN